MKTVHPTQVRRQLGARLSGDLYSRLKKWSKYSARTYPAVLADAYRAHSADFTPMASPEKSNQPFQYQEPIRVENGRLVQFYLTKIQIDLLKKLAENIGCSIAETIRRLLTRYLDAREAALSPAEPAISKRELVTAR